MYPNGSNPQRPVINAAVAGEPVPDYLRYLFVAEFEDGSQYAQTPEDASQLVEGKSAFYDVLYYTGQLEDSQPPEVKQLVRFHLTDRLNWYTVDLRDGKFEVNGMAFDAHPQFFVPNQPLTLIYFRETRAERDADGAERQYVNRYFLGWWCLGADGNKVEQTIAIS